MINRDLAKSFGVVLRNHRKAAKMSQETLVSMKRVAPPGGVVSPAMKDQRFPARRPWTERPDGESSASRSVAGPRCRAAASVEWSRSISLMDRITGF